METEQILNDVAKLLLNFGNVVIVIVVREGEHGIPEMHLLKKQCDMSDPRLDRKVNESLELIRQDIKARVTALIDSIEND